jgi:hypothetical protein
MTMKRFLNKPRSISVVPFEEGYVKKFKLVNQSDAVNGELINGEYEIEKHLFLVKEVNIGDITRKDLFSFEYDDVAYDFLRLENNNINNALTNIDDDISLAQDTIDNLSYYSGEEGETLIELDVGD